LAFLRILRSSVLYQRFIFLLLLVVGLLLLWHLLPRTTRRNHDVSWLADEQLLLKKTCICLTWKYDVGFFHGLYRIYMYLQKIYNRWLAEFLPSTINSIIFHKLNQKGYSWKDSNIDMRSASPTEGRPAICNASGSSSSFNFLCWMFPQPLSDKAHITTNPLQQKVPVLYVLRKNDEDFATFHL